MVSLFTQFYCYTTVFCLFIIIVVLTVFIILIFLRLNLLTGKLMSIWLYDVLVMHLT